MKKSALSFLLLGIASLTVGEVLAENSFEGETAICVAANGGTGVGPLIDGLMDVGAYCRENESDSEYTPSGIRGYLKDGWHIQSFDHQMINAGRDVNGITMYDVSAVVILKR